MSPVTNLVNTGMDSSNNTSITSAEKDEIECIMKAITENDEDGTLIETEQDEDKDLNDNIDEMEDMDENRKKGDLIDKKEADEDSEGMEISKEDVVVEKDLDSTSEEMEEKEAVSESAVGEVNPSSPFDKEVDSEGSVIPTENEKQQAASADVEEKHLKQEAELQAYLESLKPKPKRKSIKDMLKSMPAYQDLISLKPKIGGFGFEKKDVIYLDDESVKKETARELKRRQQIEALKDRFVRHAITAPPKPQKDLVTLKIKKKEEDSQGLEHLVEKEVEYIPNPLHEEDEAAMTLIATPQSTSPRSALPGVQRRRLQEMLLGKIRAQKKKEMEERQKEMAMYNDENDGEEKEEIIEDENSSEESEIDDDEEEEVEYLLSGPKKNKKKCKYVEDEAEDEDDDTSNDEDDDDDDDDSESGEDEEEEEEAKVAETETGPDGNVNSEGSILGDEASKEDSEQENSSSKLIQTSSVVPKDSPIIRPSLSLPKADVFNTSKEKWMWSPFAPPKENVRDEMEDTLESVDETANDRIPKSLAKVITNNDNFGDLADLCSGKFVTQVDSAALEDDDEYAGFDFGDDDESAEEATDKPSEVVKTPSASTVTDSIRSAVDGITPKLSEKISKTRLLMQFEEEAEKEAEDGKKEKTSAQSEEDDDEEEIGGVRARVIRKKKRLQFSDDEDDEPENTGAISLDPSDEEVDKEEDEMMEEIITEEPAKLNPFFNKHGRLKRKFVEDEAELSGSEEGSDDEDERGLNHYEEEDGDDEELDEDMVRKQLGRAHLERILDDDDREIRYLQNTYLENGDLHSDKQRERKFRWMNVNAMDDDAVMGNSDDEQQPDEDPEEAQKKREWIEKRKWMSENSHLLEGDEDESQSLFTNSRFLKIGKNTIKRIESFVDTSTSESRDVIIKETSIQRRSILEEIIKVKAERKKSVNNITSCSEGMSFELETDSSRGNSDLANKSVSQPLGLGDLSWSKSSESGLKKGSFLSRGQMMLAKLAETTKTGDALSNVKANSRNFVFTHITPPNPEKSDGSTSRVKRVANAGKASCNVQAKKVKIDRSFNVLDERSKGSIFKHFST